MKTRYFSGKTEEKVVDSTTGGTEALVGDGEEMEIDQDAVTTRSSDWSNRIDIASIAQVSYEGKPSFLIKTPSSSFEATAYNVTWHESQSDASTCDESTGGIYGRSITIGDVLRQSNMHNEGSGDSAPAPSSTEKLMFKDCGGLERQIKFLRAVLVDTLTGENPDQFERFGVELPKGILFHGATGTGKTRLAQALSNEISEVMKVPVHFMHRKGNYVASRYFGQSSSNLRQVFEEAQSHKPTVLFFDELDELCPSRDKPFLSQAYVTIVTTFLSLMEEVQKGEIFVIGATNRLDAIDPALRRPGRFDKDLEFLTPIEQGRQNILAIHTARWKTKPSANLLAKLAQETNRFSGADLAKLCRDAFDQALNRQILSEIQQKHVFTYANVGVENLGVTDYDWNVALCKMRPSFMGVFGSTQYIPRNKAALVKYVQLLVQENLKNVKTLISSSLPKQKEIGKTNSVYIWSAENECSLQTLEEFIVDPDRMAVKKLITAESIT